MSHLQTPNVNAADAASTRPVLWPDPQREAHFHQWLAPLVDLQLLIAAFSTLYTWYWNGTAHGQWMPDPTTLQFLQKTGYFYALFFATELASAFYAVKLDKEDKSLLWWLFWQRVVYRQMLYCVIWKATWMALTGMRQGWNKLARKGSVKMPIPNGD